MTDDDKKPDWNDIHREQGTEGARETFDEAIAQGETRRRSEEARAEFDDLGDEDEDGTGEAPPPPPPEGEGEPEPPPLGLLEIKLRGGNLLDVIEQAESAILAAPMQRLFQRGGMLVRLKRIAQKTLDFKPITAKTSKKRASLATPAH